jgi:hypothetical protein
LRRLIYSAAYLFDKLSSVVVALFEADEKNAAASKDVLAAQAPPESKRDKLLWAQGDTAMLANSKSALSVALVLATASTAK